MLPSQLELGPSRRYLWESFPGCQNPYPGCFCGALSRFFPQNFGLPRQVTGSTLGKSPSNSFTKGRCFWAAVFVSFLPASMFARHPNCSNRATLWVIAGCRGFYIRAYHGLLPPHVPDMLVVRIGQLTTGECHPIRFPALTAAPTFVTAR